MIYAYYIYIYTYLFCFIGKPKATSLKIRCGKQEVQSLDVVHGENALFSAHRRSMASERAPPPLPSPPHRRLVTDRHNGVPLDDRQHRFPIRPDYSNVNRGQFTETSIRASQVGSAFEQHTPELSKERMPNSNINKLGAQLSGQNRQFIGHPQSKELQNVDSMPNIFKEPPEEPFGISDSSFQSVPQDISVPQQTHTASQDFLLVHGSLSFNRNPAQTVPNAPPQIVSACFGKMMDLQCSDGKIIRIMDDFFGHSDNGKCEYSVDGCFRRPERGLGIAEQTCNTKTSCTNLQVTRVMCGEGYTNYQQIAYECIPGML